MLEMMTTPEDAVWREARREVDSYTLSIQDARWVAVEAGKQPTAHASTLTTQLHRALVARNGYWPSAREVRAIVNAVQALRK